MNKKIMYAILAVLFVLVMIIAVVIFSSNTSKNDSSEILTSSTDGFVTESTDGKSDEFEEEPILGNNDDIAGNRPNSFISSNNESKVSNKGESSEKPQENSKPSGSNPTDSSDPEEEPSVIDLSEYKKFLNMTSAEQQKYIASFSSIDAFFYWYNAARTAYEKENPPIEIGNGSINIGDIIEDKD